ncbi:MAG: DEAD/DEAH box helicase [Alphaproteobacteria bacterium]|nr:DEAD/DEAH box helicase [Alphaproteobacteria bacterium]
MAQDFNDFGLPAKLLQALARMQFTTPTPIQEKTIPLILAGQDILGSAQTGTGKTGAFGIPMIAKLMENRDADALIMTPTRELAGQVMAAIQQMIPVADIKTALLIGGEPMPRQFRQLNQNPRLIVGTPGRINDHLERGTLKLNKVRFLVLDETDRMLDMGFGIQIEKIVRFMPAERQTLLFSATLPANIIKLSAKYTKNAVRVAVGSTTAPIAKIQQDLIHTSDSEKYGKLLEQLEQRKGSVLIFVKTKYGTEKLSAKLNKSSHHSDAIHGDLQQRRRDRVIQGFRDKQYRILVATDVAARGLDIPHIEHVINYDLPQCPEDYIHRIGRTARAGAEGAAVNLLTPADSSKWRAIHHLLHGKEGDNQGSGQNKRTAPNKGKRKTFWKNNKGGKGQGQGYKGKRAA